MPYIVNFTDKENRAPITVFDNTSSKDTSLTFPGRNVTGYGQIIAENFLALLENFAKSTPPINPVEGQLWFDSSEDGKNLKIFDNNEWKSASGIQKGASQPNISSSKTGELWVDTTNQQLRIFTGTRWLLVGPIESTIDGLRYGPAVERIYDTDNILKSVLIFYIADRAVIIVSKDTFRPKNDILGFDIIQSGINIATPATTEEETEFESIFLGGNLPKLIGTASNSDALNIGGQEIPASRFLRTDVINTVENSFVIRSNQGMTIGTDGNFVLSTSTTASKIYNSNTGSSIDIQTNRNGIPSTILRVVDNKVGINKSSPDYELDVVGEIGLSGNLIVNNNDDSFNLSTGSIRTAGGISITKSLLVGQNVDVVGTLQIRQIVPKENEIYDLGTNPNEGGRRFNNIWAKTIKADQVEGNIVGSITGNAATATSLKNITNFTMAGDVSSTGFTFDGTGDPKVFNTALTANIIIDKEFPPKDVGFEVRRSKSTDEILTYRAGTAGGGLVKQTRDLFVGDLAVPIGTILPYAGLNPPDGYLLCDGSEVRQNQYPRLFDVIGTRYNGSTPLVGFLTFKLPDMRGRFPLGKHDMDNGKRVQTAIGAEVDAGGGIPVPPRVEGIEAETLAAAGGQSSVTLELTNIPDHTHNLKNGADGKQYAVIDVNSAIDAPAKTGLGPTAPGQAQYLENSGGITVPRFDFELGTPVPILNPFLTLNYIIRSGPPVIPDL